MSLNLFRNILTLFQIQKSLSVVLQLMLGEHEVEEEEGSSITAFIIIASRTVGNQILKLLK